MIPALSAALALLLPASGAAPKISPVWSAKFVPWPEKYTERLVVSNGRMTVSFVKHHAWNVSEIIYQGRVLGQASGATGTVITWDGKHVGTGHGGEAVRQLVLSVADREITLVGEGQERYDRSSQYEGSKLRLHKRSTIGPFVYEATFDFPAGGDFYTVRVRMIAREKVTPERFQGYRYVFMHMMPGTFTRYATVAGDGAVRGGVIEPLPDPKGQRYVFQSESFKSLLCYAPDWRMGIAYVYPQPYSGTNHLLNRGKKDIKFRAMLLADHYEPGQTAEFRLKTIPFETTLETWETMGKSLGLQTDF